MKHFTKLLASLALLIFMVAFISCDNPSSSDNNTDNNTDTTPATQVRAVFVASYEVTHGEETVLITDTITFEADGTFSVYSVEKQEDSVVFEGTVGKGTYTGNASVDGVIVMTVTHLLGDDGESFVNVADVPDYPYKEPMQMSIQDGKCSFLNGGSSPPFFYLTIRINYDTFNLWKSKSNYKRIFSKWNKIMSLYGIS